MDPTARVSLRHCPKPHVLLLLCCVTRVWSLWLQEVFSLKHGFEAMTRLLQRNLDTLPKVYVEWENLSYSINVPGE